MNQMTIENSNIFIGYDDYFVSDNTIINELYNIEYSNSSYRVGFI